MIIEELHREIDKRWPKHLSETRRTLKVPSVSMTGEGIQETADIVEGMIERLGAKHGQFKGSRNSHPLVHGHLDVSAKKTAILYGMYDVQPVGDLREWDHPPFGATIVKKKPYGEILVNRGVDNSKGALVGMMLAIETMLDKEALPVNLHFLIEGEEEIGGLSLPKFVLNNKKRLAKADVGLGFDYGEDSNGTPIISLGYKGCVYFDLVCEGSEHGGPTVGEIHSSDAVWVESPVWRLVKALSTLVDENQDPAVDGLEDDVVGPDADDKRLVKALVKRFDADAYMKEMDVKRFKVEGTVEELLNRYLFKPSLNIDGILAGYTDFGTKTVLPHRATAKVDIRLVPNMTIEKTRKKVMDHLRRRGFTDIKMRNYEDYPLSKVSPREDIVKACIEAMRYHGKEPEVWPTSAGSAPLYVFDQILGIPWGGAALGHGGRAHAPNEFAVVSKMRDYEKSIITVLSKYARISSKTGNRHG